MGSKSYWPKGFLLMSFYTFILLSILSVLASGNTVEQDLEIQQVTRLLTIENVVSTTVTTLSYTDIVYPTCTTTVPGVVNCSHREQIKPSDALELGLPSVTIPTDFKTDGTSHTYQLAEVVLPSCDCVESPRGRMPRLLTHNFITIKSTTTLTTYTTVVSTDTSTTVSITYNGCIPSDAPTTTLCNA